MPILEGNMYIEIRFELAATPPHVHSIATFIFTYVILSLASSVRFGYVSSSCLEAQTVRVWTALEDRQDLLGDWRTL